MRAPSMYPSSQAVCTSRHPSMTDLGTDLPSSAARLPLRYALCSCGCPEYGGTSSIEEAILRLEKCSAFEQRSSKCNFQTNLPATSNHRSSPGEGPQSPFFCFSLPTGRKKRMVSLGSRGPTQLDGWISQTPHRGRPPVLRRHVGPSVCSPRLTPTTENRCAPNRSA